MTGSELVKEGNVSTDHFYFEISEKVKETWASFSSTEMVTLVTSIQALENIIARLNALYDGREDFNLSKAAEHAEKMLQLLLVRVFRSSRKGIHFESGRVVFPRGGEAPYLELHLYTGTARLPIKWLLATDYSLAEELAADIPELNELLPTQVKW